MRGQTFLIFHSLFYNKFRSFKTLKSCICISFSGRVEQADARFIMIISFVKKNATKKYGSGPPVNPSRKNLSCDSDSETIDAGPQTEERESSGSAKRKNGTKKKGK